MESPEICLAILNEICEIIGESVPEGSVAEQATSKEVERPKRARISYPSPEKKSEKIIDPKDDMADLNKRALRLG